ncbi:MAG: hypothetical protein V1676_04965 [Candidatus Diapherotrites archaeon]
MPNTKEREKAPRIRGGRLSAHRDREYIGPFYYLRYGAIFPEENRPDVLYANGRAKRANDIDKFMRFIRSGGAEIAFDKERGVFEISGMQGKKIKALVRKFNRRELGRSIRGGFNTLRFNMRAWMRTRKKR